MYCTTKTLKYILHIFNIILSLFGITLIWFGFWLLKSIDESIIDHGEYLSSIVTILLGFVIVAVAIFGCISTYMESRPMLISSAVILIILLIIQVILVSISYIAASAEFAKDLKNGFEQMWDKTDHLNSTLSYYEQWLECCGRRGAEDYLILANGLPPKSCCKNYDCTNISNVFIIGCESRFKEYIHSKTTNFNIISWFLIIIEFFGSVLTCVLIDSIKNHRDRVRFYS